jgi:hypothetical protein
MSRPDEDYIDRFERGWAVAMGAAAFVLPWVVVLTYNGNDARFAMGEWMVLLLWILGATVGAAGVIAGRSVRRFRRIGTAIIVGDALGVMLFSLTIVAFFIVSYGFFYGGEGG